MSRSTPGLPVHHQLPEFTQTHVHRVSDAIQPSHPLLSPSPPAPNPSQHQGLFQWVSSSHQVAKVLEFQFQHQSSNEHPGLISFRMDWLDLLAVQGTLKSILQHHSSKASIFRRSASHSLNSATSWRVTGLDKWTRWMLLRVSRVNYPLNTFIIKVGYEELKLTTIDPKLLCKSSTTPEFQESCMRRFCQFSWGAGGRQIPDASYSDVFWEPSFEMFKYFLMSLEFLWCAELSTRTNIFSIFRSSPFL